MAIATPNLVNDPYLLRVPPASIRALGEYGQSLAKRGVTYTAVVTKIGFDMESPTPKLTFKPVGLLDEKTFKEVQTVAASDVVGQIIGTASFGHTAEEAPAVEAAPVAEAPAPKAEKKAAPAPKAQEIEVDDLNLDGLGFDD
jgi:hypothetical protein